MREIWRISSVQERVLLLAAQDQSSLLELAGQKHSYETVYDPERYEIYYQTCYNFIAAVAACNFLQASRNVSDHWDKQNMTHPEFNLASFWPRI